MLDGHRTAVVALSAGLLLVAGRPGAAQAGQRPAACTEGRFLVTQGGDIFSAAAATVLVLRGSHLTVEGPCPATGKVGKPRRKGTRLTARWKRCGAHPHVRLQATVRDCESVRGVLRAGNRRVAMVATASRCGDGSVDRGAGEQCDGSLGCDAGVPCGSSCRCEGTGAEPLECGGEGYPCRWSEVPADVLARSVAAADAAAAVLAAGSGTEEAARTIENAEFAELQYDEYVVRFRLRNGRPVWVGRPDGLDPVDDEPAPSSEQAAVLAPTVQQLYPRSVAAPGVVPKRAYILDSYAFDIPAKGGVGAPMDQALEAVEGYAGNVHYLANTTPTSQTVGLPEFTWFAGNNVVIVNSHGYTMCFDQRTNTAIPCRTAILAQDVVNPALAAIEAKEPGADLYRWAEPGEHWSISVTADFFRYYYPGGLRDALVVFDACSTRRLSDIARALEGPNSNFVGWSGRTSYRAIREILQPFLKFMGQGRHTAEVYATMGDGVRDRLNHSTALEIGTQSIRIREILNVLDAFTGETLTSGSNLQVTGYTDDGQPDGLLLVTQIDGIDEMDAHLTGVTMSVDGVQVGSGVLEDLATQDGDYRWRIDSQVDLGFDVSEGQTITVTVVVSLPEGGTSVFTASPKVTGPRFAPGRVWEGTFTHVSEIPDARVLIQVDATFERAVGQSPTSQHPIFRMTHGTMTWSIENVPSSPDSCTYSAPTTVTQLGPDEYVYFTFDLTKDPVEYFGFGDSNGPSVDLDISCSGPGSTTSSTKAGGEWFQAFATEHYTVTGDAFAGYYAAGGQFPSFYEWQLHKIE